MDEDIQRLLAGGEREAAFELVLDCYQDRVFRLALALLRNRAHAEDAAQDVLLKLWTALPSYDARASLSTWIYAIARNTCLNLLRRESYRQALPLDDAAAAPDPRSLADNAIDCRSLLESLPEKDRQVLLLFFVAQLAPPEAAPGLRAAVRRRLRDESKRPRLMELLPDLLNAAGVGAVAVLFRIGSAEPGWVLWVPATVAVAAGTLLLLGRGELENG